MEIRPQGGVTIAFMSMGKTTMGPPVQLAVPPMPPLPVPGCAVCSALTRQRQEARDRGDYSAVTDAYVEIRNHPHRTRRCVGGDAAMA